MMDKYTTEQRIKIIEFYFKNQCSIILTQREYRRHYNISTSPTGATIKKLVERFRKQGSVFDLPRSGRTRTSRSDEVVERVRQSVAEDPELSLRRRSEQLGISRSSLQRIISKELNMFPYRIQLMHEIKPTDMIKRLKYAVGFQNLARENDDFIENFLMSNEAHFYLSGLVSKNNCIFWGTETPKQISQKQLQSPRCTVWCGVTSHRIIGPYFFENDFNEAVNVNGEEYRNMIQYYLVTELPDTSNMWFQQDGTVAHASRETMELLKTIFDDRIISRNSSIKWPPHSPDLSATDFFLWGYLKERVYARRPSTLQELKFYITTEIRALKAETLRKVMENVLERTRFCEAAEGEYLQDVIVHK